MCTLPSLKKQQLLHHLLNELLSMSYIVKSKIYIYFEDNRHLLMVITTYTKFVSANVLLSQSLSITEAAITGGDKFEHTQSTCPQYTLSLLLRCLYIIHMIACVSNLGEKFSNSFNLSLYFPLFTSCIFLSVVFFFL